MHTELLHPTNLFLALVIVASLTAVAVRFIKVPYTVALVVAGLLMSMFGDFNMQMTPELVLLVFLPALLFEASWNIDLKHVKSDWVPITIMASLGVVVSVALSAAVVYFVGGFDLKLAIVFAAIISATDPVSVVAMFRKLGVSKRLTMLLEGESLLNDGTAVLAFKLAVATVLTSASVSVGSTVVAFSVSVFGGLALGVAAGLLMSALTRFFDDHYLEITFTIILAYGTFMLAEHYHLSAVLATVSASVILGNFGKRFGMSPTTRLAVHAFWENAAFLVNSVLFILVGSTIKVGELLADWKLVLVALLAVACARLVVVFATPSREPISWTWRVVLFWGGLRGALSMALALSLPVAFPGRDEILHMTFAVVLFSLLAQGLTIGSLINRLKINVSDENEKSYRLLRARLMAKVQTRGTLSMFKESHQISVASYDALSARLESEIKSVEAQLNALLAGSPESFKFELSETERELIILQKDHLRHQLEQGSLDENQLGQLIAELDQQLEALDKKH